MLLHTRAARRIALLLMLMLCMLLSGCNGGQEIESCLFVLAMAIDPAPDGTLTVTVKALSGTQDTPSTSGPSSSGQNASGADGGNTSQSMGGEVQNALEDAEPGYIVLSATAPSCLRALGLLSATTPRTVNLSQLREIVINRTLAETDATLSILREIYAMFRANGEAVVVVTPNDAGDFIRRQHAILGLRLSKYLEVLFEHFGRMDLIPPRIQLSAVIAAMESSTTDATAVYAAGNAFDATLVLPGTKDTDRLPGYLPRTAPAENEYMGCAIFDGPRMTGTLTGEETGLLCLMLGAAQRQTTIFGSSQYKAPFKARVKRSLREDALSVSIHLTLTRIAGEQALTADMIGAQIEQKCVNVLRKLQAASCDALGFGQLAIVRCLTIADWEHIEWKKAFMQAPVQVSADIRLL